MTDNTQTTLEQVTRKTIGELIERAAKASAIDALQLTQAANNAANTLCAFNHAQSQAKA